MQRHLPILKRAFLGIGLTLFLTTPLAANTALNNHTTERRINDLEDRYDSHIERVTPNASPHLGDGWGFYFTGDFIYWTTRLNGLAFAQSGNGALAATTNIAKGKNHQIDWDYNPGFKAGIGVNMGRDGWDTYLRYTWLRASARGSTRALNLVPISPFPASSIVRAESSHRHRFNVIDWELGRAYFTSKRLTLRPFIGLKGAWFSERTVNKYLQVASTALSFDARERNVQHDWGLGIRPGLNTSWYLNDNFSIIGDFALSALWSYFKLSHISININQTSRLETKFENIDQGFHAIRPIIECDIGFKWEDWYYDCKFHIAFQVTWENQIWIHNTYFIEPSDPNQKFDLTTQGLTAQLRFDF